ncbi:MAG: TatD family hydrolase [Bdellovibrionales bacterium]
MYIDSHCHLTDPRLKNVLHESIESALGKKICYFLNAGYSPADLDDQLKLKIQYENIFTSFGIHPYWVHSLKDRKDNIVESLEKMDSQRKIYDFIGEIGIDGREQFQRSIKLQEEIFSLALDQAITINKPIILHIVRSHAKAIEILKSKKTTLKGMVHAFNGSIEIANEYLDLGLKLSIGAAATVEKNKKLVDSIRKLDLSHLLLESDSPDSPPRNFPFPQNRPESILLVAESVGKIKGIKPQTVLSQCTENFSNSFFKIGEL